MREKLPPRRHVINRIVKYEGARGNTEIVVSIGYDDNFHVREVFCADFKAGSDAQALAVDACILLSRLLQHGDTPEDLAAHLCSPPSIIGVICKAVCDERTQNAQGVSAGFDKKEGTEHADT